MKIQTNEERRKSEGFIRLTTDYLCQVSEEPEEGFTAQLFIELQNIDWSKSSISTIRIGVSETVEMCQILNAEGVRALDRKLKDNELPTLTHMKTKQYRDILAIISRGKITKDEEWNAIQSQLALESSSILSTTEKRELDLLAHKYEKQAERGT